MTLSKWVRQAHRWVSVVFVVLVIANIVAIAMGKQEDPPGLLTYSPLLPLFLLMFSGMYMFVLPYVAKRRSARRTEGDSA